ncbi:MAG: hypothetical protein H0W08_24285 [Acidobacteria bacterium]|nr:hypothetical protein [Acidobacteriota bacterium]
MRLAALVAVLGMATISWAALHGQQEMLSKPGPGSGITTISGVVTIANTPTVTIANTPDVRVVQMPPMTIASPAFVRKGGRYSITWAEGDREDVTILDAGQDGWVQVENLRRRWVNLGAARAVEESR